MPAAKVGGRFRRGGQALGRADKVSDTTRSAMVDETERHRMSSPTGLRRETDGENGRRLGVRTSVRQRETDTGKKLCDSAGPVWPVRHRAAAYVSRWVYARLILE